MKTNKMLIIQKSPTLDELYRGCKARKAKTQKALYDRMAPKMLGVCLRYVKDKNEGEHIMIGGFVKVFEKIDQYSGEGSFEGWVRRIIVNEALMYIRKNQNMSIEVELESAENQMDYTVLDDSMDAEEIVKLIQELPIGYKTVFNLYAIEGYSHLEIAKKLEISESTSKSQLSRARKLLQNKLEQREMKENERMMNHGKS